MSKNKPTKKELEEIAETNRQNLLRELAEEAEQAAKQTGKPIKQERPAAEVQAEYEATFRKQAEKHFGRKDIMIVKHDNGELEAVVVGKQAEAPNTPTKPAKPATQPVRASETPSTYVPPVKTRLTNYVRTYAFDAIHQTHELAIYREAIRKAKQARLRKDLGLVEDK